jgi:hypothetical protein
MRKQRAAVLYMPKVMFEGARSAVAREIDFIDLCLDGEDYVGGNVRVPIETFAPDRTSLSAVDALMAAKPFHYVVSTSESNVAFAGFLRSKYGLPGLNFEQALTVTNKWRMKQLVKGKVATAENWLSGDFVEQARGGRALPTEVVVKPLSGSSTKGVRRVPTGDALAYLAVSDEVLLVEEAIDIEEELHCDGVVRDGELRAVIASGYDRPVLGPPGTNLASIHLPPSDERRERCVAAAREVIGIFDIPDFVFHLELLQSKGTLYFGEIGFRPAGGGRAQSFRRFYGLDLWDEYVRMQVARPAAGATVSTRQLAYCGMVGIAARLDQTDPRRLLAEEILAIPGIVAVERGSRNAADEARAGSSVAYTHMAFFESEDLAGVHRILASVEGCRDEL